MFSIANGSREYVKMYGEIYFIAKARKMSQKYLFLRYKRI